jgi:hypothetical protein
MAGFIPADPFSISALLGSPLFEGLIDPQANWQYNGGLGATDTGDNIEVGQANASDESDATVLQTGAARNATFVAWNNPGNQSPAEAEGPDSFAAGGPSGSIVGEAYIGLWGRTTGLTRSAGVLGLSDTSGCGVYGITGSRNFSSASHRPTDTLPEFGSGIGVAGRAMDGVAAELSDLPSQFEFQLSTDDPKGGHGMNLASIGVVGTSTSHIGVRGHGGPIAGPLTMDISEARGGVFSAGRPFQETSATEGEWMSEGAFPQIRLIPFMSYLSNAPEGPATVVPKLGKLGDLFATIELERAENQSSGVACALYLCVRAGDGSLNHPTAWARLKMYPPAPTNAAPAAPYQLGDSFDADDPFRFGGLWSYLLEQAGVLNLVSGSAQETGDDLAAGVANTATSPDTTVITGHAPRNAALFVENDGAGPPFEQIPQDSDGLIAVFGRSAFDSAQGNLGSDPFVPSYLTDPDIYTGIGVAGSVDQRGCGVYGLTGSTFVATAGPEVGTGPEPLWTSANARFQGIGVVGRAMNGFSVEDPTISIENLFDSSIGVLGTSTWGVGIWGHSGPLEPPNLEDSLPPVDSPPVIVQKELAAGGVFSVGRLEGQEMSLDAIPQIRLIPGLSSQSLPSTARLGDIYVQGASSGGQDQGPTTCLMFLCVQTGDGDAAWAEFELGPTHYV